MFAVVSSVSAAGHLLVAHLDVVHTHEISAVVQVLFEVTVLEDSHSVNVQTFWTGARLGRSAHQETADVLTRYSKTSVRQRSVWIMSCRVTMLACFRFFSSDTEGQQTKRRHICKHAVCE